jgi:hypothetical protein
MIPREIGEQVGGCVGIHFLDNVGGAFGIERFDNRPLNAGIDFFESLGCDIFVEGAENSFALIGREVFDNIGNIRGVERSQALVRNFEFYPARGIGFDEVDKTPGDGAFRNFFEQNMKSGAWGHSSQQAANGAADADVDRVDAESSMRDSAVGGNVDLQVDVVDANHFAAMNVDDLLIEKVALKQE